MILKHDFEIDSDFETVWNLLEDLGRVIPCMPGATLEGFDGDKALANVTVKVGPITSTLGGHAYVDARDRDNSTAVIVAKGKDKRGQASAQARISASLVPLDTERTRVELSTDLDITGRLAQFGRGVIVDISNRLLSQFVANLRTELEQPTQGPQSAPGASKPAEPVVPGTTLPTGSTVNADEGAAVMGPVFADVTATWIRNHGPALAVGGVIGAAVTALLRRRPVVITLILKGPSHWRGGTI